LHLVIFDYPHRYCCPWTCGPVHKLQGVQERVCDGLQVDQDQSFKDLHDHRDQGDGSVVIEACDLGLLGDGDDDGGLEAGWYTTQLQRGVEDVGEHGDSIGTL